MKIIGLTGGIACGKTTVAKMLKELGASVIDADQISHELTAPGGDALES
ncbi:MAG: dephospho-CoA kinase, partial [Clostridia bacterium]